MKRNLFLSEPAQIIPETSSVLLDGLRLSAALIVLVHHAEDIWFPSPDNLYGFFGKAAHAAVILFFALSGYVIAYTTTRNNRGPRLYAQARLSRLCSVVIPALLITGLIECFLRYNDPATYQVYTRDHSWIRYIISGTFLNEIWFFSAAPLINTPLWSLSFEFWYYVIFGVFFYKGKGKTSFLLPIIACLIAGPKILIMLPIWLAGYTAYRVPKIPLTQTVCWLLLLISFILAVIIVLYVPPLPYPPGTLPWIFASQFFTDWLIGLFVALALWFLPLSKVAGIPSPSLTIFRKIADLTFPIYVLDKPFLILWQSIFHFKIHDKQQQLTATVSVLIISGLLGLALERARPAWASFFRKIFTGNQTLK